jgi:hypothetical protein
LPAYCFVSLSPIGCLMLHSSGLLRYDTHQTRFRYAQQPTASDHPT